MPRAVRRALLLAACVASPGTAQSVPGPSGSDSAASARLCFRGRPLDRCASFLILESGVALGLPTSSRRPPANLIWEAGWMRNTSPVSAYGGTLVGHFDEDERVMIGAKFRYRRWLTDVFALDLAPGVVFQASEGGYAEIGPGFVGHAGLSVADWGAVVVQVELMNLPEGDIASDPAAIFLGLRAGSYPALVVGSFLGWFADWVTQFD